MPKAKATPKANAKATPAGLTLDDIAELQAFVAADPDTFEVDYFDIDGAIAAEIGCPIWTFMVPDFAIVRTSPDSITVSVSCFDWKDEDAFEGSFSTMADALAELRALNEGLAETDAAAAIPADVTEALTPPA
jgi:hypothetical protein